jgi:hypothetical protein
LALAALQKREYALQLIQNVVTNVVTNGVTVVVVAVVVAVVVVVVVLPFFFASSLSAVGLPHSSGVDREHICTQLW